MDAKNLIDFYQNEQNKREERKQMNEELKQRQADQDQQDRLKAQARRNKLK